MNCEQVREQLSAYLDSELAREEREKMAIHLETCRGCKEQLNELRHFDVLIARLPRMTPDERLREKLFSSAEYRELTGTAGSHRPLRLSAKTRPATLRLRNGRPYLIALPPVSQTLLSDHEPSPRRSHARRFQRRSTRTLISMLLLLILGAGTLFSWRLWQQLPSLAANNDGGATVTGPLPAGTRFVFQRDNALWSISSDGAGGSVRLTPTSSAVAENWAVRPVLPGHSAGNMIAYIDLQSARVHLIQSNGQQDKTIAQPLLRPGMLPARVWDTSTGAAILDSLAWSNDGSMLAFVADPQETGKTALYIYTLNSDSIQMVSLPETGLVAHPVWSPDNARLAFLFRQGSQNGIFDYNVENHGLLTISENVASAGHPTDNVLTLDWSPDTTQPELTWSVGSNGHVHGLWWKQIGLEANAPANALAVGDYREAAYSPTSFGGNGGWLLVDTEAGKLETISLADASIQQTEGQQVTHAAWSPDGSALSYLVAASATQTSMGNIATPAARPPGMLHMVETESGEDTLIAKNVASVPAPVWSPDSQRLAYSTDSASLVVARQKPQISQALPVQGTTASLAWFATPPDQLLLAISDGQTGIYQISTSSNTAQRLDNRAASGPLCWTQIP